MDLPQEKTVNFKTLSKRTDQNLDFFTDPLSPYQTAPYSVKKIFVNQGDKNIRIEKDFLIFQSKPGLTHICTAFFPSGTYYYTCRQCCCQSKPGTTMCFCQSCWQPEKHVGHNFKKNMASGGAYCDCGRQCRIKPQSFCRSHSDKTQRNLQIFQQKRTQYMDYYESLFMCYLYIKLNQNRKNAEKQLQVHLNKSIQQQCAGSLYYIRLTTQILDKQIKYGAQQPCTILKLFLTWNKTSERMLFALLGDNQFKYKIAKTIVNLKNNGWQPENLRLIMSQLYQTDDIFYRYAQNGQFISNQQQKYVEIAKRSQKGTKLLIKYIQNQKRSLKQPQLVDFLIGMFNQNSYQFLFEKRIITEILVNTLLKQIAGGYTWNSDKSIKIIPTILMSFFCLVDGNMGKVNQIQALDIIKENYQGFNQFILNTIGSVRHFILKSDQKKHYWVVVLLGIINSLENKEEYYKKIWVYLTQDDSNLRQDLVQIMTAIYHLTAIIANSIPFFNSLSKNNKQQKTQRQNENWMKSFLYQNGEITRNQLLKSREKGFFKFQNAGTILKQVCRYIQARDVFEYKSQKKYPNYLMRFKVQRSNKQLNSIPKRNFRLSDTYEPKQPYQISEIFNNLFNNQHVASKFCSKWYRKMKAIQKSQQQSNFWKNYDMSFYFILTLVYCSVFSNHKNISLQNQIIIIKQDLELRKKLNLYTSSPEQINILLQIQQQKQITKQKYKNNQQNLCQQNQNNHNRKKLIQLKKKKFAQKFKISQQKFMNTYSPDKKSDSQQQQLKCIICRQTHKPNDKLIYIASLQKNTSIAYSLYGNQDKCQINISSCLHQIHFSCYFQMNKTGIDFNCPLCTKKSNIYLPTDSRDRKSIKRCSNIINAIQIVKYKNHDFTSLLIIYLKHLTQSYGLNSILFKNFQNQKKKIRKIDKILLQMSVDLASNLSKIQLQQFLQQYTNLHKSINQCKKQGLKIVQKLFLTTLYNKLFNKQSIYDRELLKLTQYKMVQQQYSDIKASLQELTGQKIQDKIQIQQKYKLIQQQNKNKYSISFKATYPPLTNKQFQNFGEPICLACQKQPTNLVCLLCKQSYCNKCILCQLHQSQHNNSYVALQLVSKKLLIKQNNGKVNGSHNIYFDTFMSSFEDQAKYKSTEIYQLNVNKIEKLLSSYLLRI